MAENVDSWFSRHHFLLRRLHSLAGITLVGAFLIEHLLTNSLAWFGPEKFNEQVYWLHNLHYLIWLEILFIFLPLAFHACYGIVIALQGRLNARRYPYVDNWRYTLQRVTAWVAVVFVLVHLAHFRFAHWFGGESYPGTPDPFWLTQRGFLDLLLPAWAWSVVYVVGLVAVVFHFCNGIVTFCITWGIAVSVDSRKRITVAAGAVFAVLMIWGIMSLHAFRTLDYTPPAVAEESAHVTGQQVALPGSGS